jgi:hypothetical protein
MSVQYCFLKTNILWLLYFLCIDKVGLWKWRSGAHTCKLIFGLSHYVRTEENTTCLLKMNELLRKVANHNKQYEFSSFWLNISQSICVYLLLQNHTTNTFHHFEILCQYWKSIQTVYKKHLCIQLLQDHNRICFHNMSILKKHPNQFAEKEWNDREWCKPWRVLTFIFWFNVSESICVYTLLQNYNRNKFHHFDELLWYWKNTQSLYGKKIECWEMLQTITNSINFQLFYLICWEAFVCMSCCKTITVII